MLATLLMLPPQTKTTHQWAERLALDVPDVSVIVAEDAGKAARAIAEADCAYGTLPRALLAAATRLRWLQAPQAAPPAGWYYPELIAHRAVVTNFREIYNDHIGAHIMAFVLAFARGLHQYLPQQLERVWRPAPLDAGVIHLPEATALVVGVGGIGAEAARLAAAFGMRVIGVDARRRDAPPGMVELHGAEALDSLLPRADFVILTVPHTPASSPAPGSTFSSRSRCRPTMRCGPCPASSSRRTPPASGPTWMSAATISCSTTAAASSPGSRSATWSTSPA